MKLSTISIYYSLAAIVTLGTAWPGMAKVKIDLTQSLSTRDINDEHELIGDLLKGATTPVGKSVANIIRQLESGESSLAGYAIPGPLGSDSCSADICCVWAHVSAVLTQAFVNQTSGQCNGVASAAIRLGFHDAGTWSKSRAAAGQDFGGADGSIVLAAEEKDRHINNGLQSIIEQTKVWHGKFGPYGAGMADLIQFAAIHAVVSCPLGPRLRVFVGRKDSSTPSIDGLMPDVTDTADKLLSIFADKTFTPNDLVALLGAHSIARQFHVDESLAGQPLDSSPGVWDMLFYNQTLAPTAPSNVFRLQSDMVLTADKRTSPEWVAFAVADQLAHLHWNKNYAYAYTRLSMLGVNNINQLTECTKVLPKQITSLP